MIVGVPQEVKTDEYRIALLPVGARLLKQDGHRVLIQRGAGLGSGFTDDQYLAAGAEIINNATELYSTADLVVKVKEPRAEEIALLREDQTLFCYFHFAADDALTRGCLQSGITAVAYETLQDAHGQLPLLTPMSEVAGKMSIQEGAKYLERPMKGRGILLGGVTGVAPANVLVLGAGVVGTNAALIAAGLGANVTIMDINLDRLRYLDEILSANVSGIYSDPDAIEDYASRADLIIGAVLLPGARAPKLIPRALLAHMPTRSVIVDVCIDQGGSAETSKPTTHSDPTFVVDDVVHYCVANMPGAVGRTSSQALCNATLPYLRQLARLGDASFADLSPGHALAINMRAGRITNEAVAEAFGG
jgi:alanine dehydrogenase